MDGRREVQRLNSRLGYSDDGKNYQYATIKDEDAKKASALTITSRGAAHVTITGMQLVGTTQSN